MTVVYCTKCGTQNEDAAKYCSKCGADLEGSREKTWEKRAEEWGEEFGKRAEEECFGLPHGGAIVGLVIGIIIILVGVSRIIGFEWEFFWPLIVIIFGILILVGAVYGLRHR